jgi:uncharacterized membrane protein YhaH (DUF805 family)
MGQLASIGGVIVVIVLVYLVVVVFELAAVWKVFAKAGQPGWAAIIPIYNFYVLCKVAGRPGWWVVLFMIPVVSVVVGIIVLIDLAAAFGKSGGFAAGLILLGFIFFPILGFGSDQYRGNPSSIGY